MRWLSIFKLPVLVFLHEPLATLITLQMLQNALNVLGYPAVTLFIMIESSGIPFPLDTQKVYCRIAEKINMLQLA